MTHMCAHLSLPVKRMHALTAQILSGMLAGMSDVLSPQEIEARARSVGFSISELCRAAGIYPSTFHHWRAGRHDILLRNYKQLLQVIEQKGNANGVGHSAESLAARSAPEG